MDPTHFKRTWPQRKADATSKWSKITEEDFTSIDGRLELLVGKIRDRYQISEAEANRQVDEFLQGDSRPRGDVAGS